MTGLTVDDFPTFVEAVHDWRPFPWQTALVHSIVARESWPGVIDIPTGLGKTAVIDVFVYLAAMRPDLARRRLFFVVDRRVIVDEAYEHARAIARSLRQPKHEDVARVADRLHSDRQLTAPLTVVRMRGGATWDWRWLDRPDQPAVVVGTVAQLGSRLLFRGYGVSEYRRSLDAALVGTDSVIVVDEAHLAEQFLRSAVDAIALDEGQLVPKPVMVTMSATVASAPGWAHELGDDAQQSDEARRRLYAAKRLRVESVVTTKAKANAVADRLQQLATDLADEQHPTVAVLTNTVARARAVLDRLREADHEAVLLTGAMRGFDRERWMQQYFPRFRAGRDEQPERPLFLVATQTVEVGANIDVHALVTESASLDAIVQRLGRLNRLGRYNSAPAVVVHDDLVEEDDPIYGPARLATWRWLRALTRDDPGADGVDVGPLALRARIGALSANERDAMTRPGRAGPVLTKDRLDALTRTSPTPVPDVPVGPFLYGFRADAGQVTVVWRAGLDPANDDAWATEVGLVPPAADEGIELPIGRVRRWLANVAGADDVNDALNTADEIEGDDRPVILIRNGEDPRSDKAHAIRPSDIVVVPTLYGGCDDFGWAPTRAEEVLDVGDVVTRRGRRVVRLGPSLRRHLPAQLHDAFTELLSALTSDDVEPTTLVREWAAAVRPDLHDVDAYVLRAIEDLGRAQVSVGTGSQASVGTARVGASIHTALADDANYGPSDQADASCAEDASALGSSAVGVRVTLTGHQQQVAALAREFAVGMGLPADVVASIERAARLHDEGKRDPRFQAMLHGGSPWLAEAAAEPLAKSGMDPTNRVAMRRARDRSGYPRGMRHEALSSRIIAASLAAADAASLDPELVIHLAASHHGRSRPLFPPVVDDCPATVSVPESADEFGTAEVVDWDAPSRFVRLNQRYGHWGLALCEAVVRLADMAASEQPKEGVLGE